MLQTIESLSEVEHAVYELLTDNDQPMTHIIHTLWRTHSEMQIRRAVKDLEENGYITLTKTEKRLFIRYKSDIEQRVFLERINQEMMQKWNDERRKKEEKHNPPTLWMDKGKEGVLRAYRTFIFENEDQSTILGYSEWPTENILGKAWHKRVFDAIVKNELSVATLMPQKRFENYINRFNTSSDIIASEVTRILGNLNTLAVHKAPFDFGKINFFLQWDRFCCFWKEEDQESQVIYMKHQSFGEIYRYILATMNAHGITVRLIDRKDKKFFIKE